MRTDEAAGQRMRRTVLGDPYVDKALANASEFSRPLQEYLNGVCWGGIWTREGLDPKTRSVVTLTVLATTNKWTELKTHVRGALRNGWTSDELREMLLHIGMYAGIPTAVEAFRTAEPVIAEVEAELARDG